MEAAVRQGSNLGGAALRRSLLALSLLIWQAALPVDARADSMLGAGHLGVPVPPSDARSRGMGGVSMALTGEDFSFDNPARNVNFWRSGFNAVMTQNFRTLNGADRDVALRSTDFHSFKGVFPAYKQFVFSFGIYQWRDLTWEYQDRVAVELLGGEALRTLSSEGGVYVARLSVARNVIPHLALGLGLDWVVGNQDLLRKMELGTGYISTREQVQAKYSCLRPTVGVLAGVKTVNVGFSLTTSRTADTDFSYTLGGGYREKVTRDQEYPLAWRLGFSWRPTRRMVVGADLERELWGKVQGATALGGDIDQVNQQRFGLGVELLPAAGENPPLWRSIPLRAGWYQTTYPFHLGGEEVRERFLTFGAGNYFGKNVGMINGAVEIGKRSSLAEQYPDEAVVRLVFSLSAFERWVPQPRRR